jgi:hypothetical protein
MRISREGCVAAMAALLWATGPSSVAQEPPEALPSFAVAPDAAPAAAKGGPGVEPSTGSYTRMIPIEVPAFHGIEPRLALAYSSQAGNGFVGVGWRLAGFSVVERTRNGRGTPRFTPADVYVLDGQELLPCSSVPHSPGCAAGGTHATKQESYARVQFDGTKWTVWTRNGVRTELAPVLQASGGTLRWGQSRTVDEGHPNNTVTYAWQCANGDCYPASVSFGPFEVTLLREIRPDVLSFATGGPSGIGQTRYRLASVVVSRGGTKIRAYRLGYVPSAVTTRSLLREVQQYGTDVVLAGSTVTGGTALPSQVFRYQGTWSSGPAATCRAAFLAGGRRSSPRPPARFRSAGWNPPMP